MPFPLVQIPGISTDFSSLFVLRAIQIAQKSDHVARKFFRYGLYGFFQKTKTINSPVKGITVQHQLAKSDFRQALDSSVFCLPLRW